MEKPLVISSKFDWRDIPFKRPVQGVIIHSMNQYINKTHAPEFLNNLKNSKGLNISSAHAFIEPNGNIILGQSIQKIAYHAGKSKWKHLSNLNDYTLGIEFLVEGDLSGARILERFLEKIKNPSTYTEKQYESGAWLIKEWMKIYPSIEKEWILKHSDVSTKEVRDDPKSDPGDGFNFNKLISLI